MLTVPPGSAHTNHPCFEKKHFAPRNDEAGTLGGDGGWGLGQERGCSSDDRGLAQEKT